MDIGGAAAAGEREDGLVQELMSAMNKLLDQNRSQMASMNRMEGEMKSMKVEMEHLRDKCDTMEKSLQDQNSRFDNVENKQQYHEVLLKNLQWEYSATPAEVGDPERRFLDQIKAQTCEMRHGKCNGEVEINMERLRLRYDAAFLPHWREFADALWEYHYALKCLPKDASSKLSIEGVELPREVLDMLSWALKSTHFKSLRLCENNFGRDGMKFALNYMQNNPVLEVFTMAGNPIHRESYIHRLCEVIREHPTVHTIQLYAACGEGINGHEMLSSIMTAGLSKLESIVLCRNRISTEGSTFIANCLATNPILERLVLYDNNIDDEDAKSISSALKHNTNLRYFNVNENEITNLGWSALSKAEFDSTSLNSAADSNHTCSIHSKSKFNGRRHNEWFEPNAVRQKKIYSILSSRNRECSNIQSLDDVPVEILPDMLTSIQRYSEYYNGDNAPPKHDGNVEALSVVYEIMRFWNEAFSVYEALSDCVNGTRSFQSLSP